MVRRAGSAVLLAVLAACSPELDWREVRPEGSRIVALFPCKADTFDRRVEVAAKPVRMRMRSCAAGGMTFAISQVDLADAAEVPAALRALRAITASNLGAGDPALREWVPAGGAVVPEGGRASIDGRLPDGRAVRAEAAFFATGAQVHQASLVAERPVADAAETFFSGIKVER